VRLTKCTHNPRDPVAKTAGQIVSVACVPFMSPPISTDRRHSVFYVSVVRPSVRPFVRCQTREHDILKTNRQISVKIGTNGRRGKRMKKAASGARRSKVKVMGDRN